MCEVKIHVAIEFGNVIYVSVQTNNLVEIAASYAIQTIRENGIYINYKYIRIKRLYVYNRIFFRYRKIPLLCV